MDNKAWYHVSRKKLPEIVVLTPKVPDTCGPDEDKVMPRICVAPTIQQCLIGIAGTKDIYLEFYRELLKKLDFLYVYTSHIEQPVEASRVPDKHITDEHWFLNPTKFIFSHIITYDEFKLYCDNIK